MTITFFKRVLAGVWHGWKRQVLAMFGAVIVMATVSTGAASAAQPPGQQVFEGFSSNLTLSMAIWQADTVALQRAAAAGYPQSSCRANGNPWITRTFEFYNATVQWICGQAVPGTVYNTELKAGHTGMCAAVGGNNENAGMWFIQYKCDGKANKKFDLIPTGAASQYYLKVRSTQMCMVPESTGNHAVIVQNPCDTSARFQWTLIRQGDGKFTMVNAQSNLCLGVAWGMTGSGQPLDQTTCGAFTGQAWTIPGLGSPTGNNGGGGGDDGGGGDPINPI